VQGLEWVAKNHIKPAVVHMSIEGSFSSIVNQAVEQLIKVNHVHVVVSSGQCSASAAACRVSDTEQSRSKHTALINPTLLQRGANLMSVQLLRSLSYKALAAASSACMNSCQARNLLATSMLLYAGNSGKDACLASPASAPSAITVAAIDNKICRWAYANW
jgi:hypothetical protein